MFLAPSFFNIPFLPVRKFKSASKKYDSKKISFNGKIFFISEVRNSALAAALNRSGSFIMTAEYFHLE